MWPVGGVTLHFCFIVIIIITITKLSGPQVPWCPRCFSRIVHAQQAFVAPEYSQLSIISGGKTIKIQLVPPTGDVTALHTEYGLAKKEKRRRRKKKKDSSVWFSGDAGLDLNVNCRAENCMFVFGLPWRGNGTINSVVFTRLTYSADISDRMTLQLHTVTSKGDAMTDHDLAPRGE